jgi:hypothetical protein
MFIYKIPYDSRRYPNSLTDFLDFIRLVNTDLSKICLFAVHQLKPAEKQKYYTLKYLHIIFSADYYPHFEPLLSLYEAKKLNNVTSFNSATLLAGNGKLLQVYM